MKKLALLLLALASCTTPTKPTSKAGDAPAAAYSGHGAESVDAATLARFAPPALPPETARFVQNILELAGPGLGVVTPDGKTMFFNWAITGTPQVWKLDGPMRFPVQVTSGVDPTNVVHVAPDGKFIVLSRDRAGEENPGVYIQSTEGGPLVEVQHKKGVRTSFAWLTNDAATLYYMANDIKPDSYAMYAYSVAKKTRELVFSEPGLWFVADIYGDDTFLLARATGARTREFFKWTRSSKKLAPVIGQDEKEEYIVTFGQTPNDYIVLTPKLGDFRRVYTLKGGTLLPVTPDVKMDIDDISVDHARFRLYVQYNDNGSQKLEVRDNRTLKVVDAPKFPGAAQVVASRLSRFGRFVTVAVEMADRPRQSYLYDWKDKKLTQWSRGGLPEVDGTKFAEQKQELYPARDGTKIPMLVTRPKSCAAQPCPIVVHFHGGPEGQSTPAFSRLGQIFASAGFVFAEPNVRGSEGYGKAWLSADDGPKRLDVLSDIEDAAIYLRQHFGAGGKAPRVGVMGWSYGGYATLMAMSKYAGAYDAGVALVGMSNLRTFLLNTAPYRRLLRITEYGDPEKDREALEKLSATSYLDKIKSPLMIVQGVSDPRVPAGEAIQIQSLLEKRGVKAPLILFANEGHGSVKRENQVLEIGHMLRFFQEHLQERPAN